KHVRRNGSGGVTKDDRGGDLQSEGLCSLRYVLEHAHNGRDRLASLDRAHRAAVVISLIVQLDDELSGVGPGIRSDPLTLHRDFLRGVNITWRGAARPTSSSRLPRS